MARVPYLSPTRTDGYALEILEEIEEQLGRQPNLYRTLAHSPGILGAIRHLERALRRSRIPARLRAMADFQVARVRGNDVFLALARRNAEVAGLPVDLLDSGNDLESLDGLEPAEVAVGRYAATLARDERPTTRETAALVIGLDAGQQVEIEVAIGLALTLARFCDSFSIDPDEN